ncbi:MAG TPA: hypothetical protein VFP72_15570, partial [Kineosporiaceae bacterium]|nr:hypothetical protein [Kineosporiaceae bacterium]
RSVARKTLLAVAGVVSVHDRTWTTDRGTAARRWGRIHPDLAAGMTLFLAWSEGSAAPGPPELARALDEVVDPVVGAFEDLIGLWN